MDRRVLNGGLSTAAVNIECRMRQGNVIQFVKRRAVACFKILSRHTETSV
jgi:hypothetical protein